MRRGRRSRCPNRAAQRPRRTPLSRERWRGARCCWRRAAGTRGGGGRARRGLSLGEAAVEGRQAAGQRLDVPQDLVVDLLAHLPQVVVPLAVHRQAERHDALALRLHERLVGVVDGVLLLRAVAAVAVVLGPAVVYG